MRHKTSQTLFAYWNDVRGNRIAPRRFDIEPARIGDILPDTFILERANFETFPFRLAGTRICERFGYEFRGQNFLEGWSEDDRDRLERDLSTLTLQGGVGLLVVEAATAQDKALQFEVLLLPLTHTNNRVERFLGCMSALASPVWLGYERLVTKRILSGEVIWADGRPHAVVEHMNRQVPFLPHIRAARIVRSNRRQFRVYDGGKSGREDDRQ